VVPARIKRAIVAATSLVVASSLIGSAFGPYLLTHHPVLLLVLGPESHHVVLTTQLLPGWLIISLTTFRRVVGLVALYGFGWAHGQGALLFIERRFGRIGKLLRWVEKSVARFGSAVVLFAPMPAVCVMAGVAETRFFRTVLAMAVGQLFWVSVVWAFGDLISVFTTPFVEFLSDHVLEATLICVFAVATWQTLGYLRRRKSKMIPEEDQQ